ncbi:MULTISPECIES: hypothetical protein [Halorussus]|uniref:hypothetical protein n=1 Tax=Halorussus TaxID=1070314 RepID=UPI0020A08292|nr:hypothetical protein [Halorussus vallis]USZ76322.1 hypothetical protein NGM07_03100 [Halorussus vallis]
MIVWQTAKRWKYKGRTCEIQRSSVGDAQFRGLVRVETGIPDRALSASPVDGVRSKRRPKRHAPGEYRTWVYFAWSGAESERSDDGVPTLRSRVNNLAEHMAKAEL